MSKIIEEALSQYLSDKERGVRLLKEALYEFENCEDVDEKCYAAVRMLRAMLRALREGSNYCEILAKLYTNAVESGLC
jgi:invasion protein IalB